VDFTGKFPTDCSQESCCGFILVFGRKFSCGFWKPQETITYEGFSWEPKSAGNVFPADFGSKSAGKKKISSSVRTLFKKPINIMFNF
jgi:hypothetical protein